MVDVSGVTFVDLDGERVLAAMMKDGAEFIATGVYTKHILEIAGEAAPALDSQTHGVFLTVLFSRELPQEDVHRSHRESGDVWSWWFTHSWWSWRSTYFSLFSEMEQNNRDGETA